MCRLLATEAPSRLARDIIEDRYRTVVTDVVASNAGETNSAVYDRLSSAIRELAGRVALGVHGDDEYQRLCDLESELVQHIRERIVDFGAAILEGRQ
jgi:microcystin degradation protein MlrC